jgi:16S rRNA (guanine966-N2)-methyltransferase
VTRIVGGTLGGRRLVTPPGAGTRPTAEKVRAALANSLQATGGLDGARVLDLYAGSGALGLELLSRGASTAVFVEKDRAALTALRSNAALVTQGVAVVAADVLSYLGTAGIGPYDVVLADPPYDLAQDDLLAVLGRLTRAGALAAHADVIVERGVKAGEPAWPDPLTGVRVRRYGDTLLCYGRAP